MILPYYLKTILKVCRVYASQCKLSTPVDNFSMHGKKALIA